MLAASLMVTRKEILSLSVKENGLFKLSGKMLPDVELAGAEDRQGLLKDKV